MEYLWNEQIFVESLVFSVESSGEWLVESGFVVKSWVFKFGWQLLIDLGRKCAFWGCARVLLVG